MSELVLEAKESLPNTWSWSTIEEISSRIHYGYTETATKKNTGVNYLRITDIQNNTVDWQNVPYCNISVEEITKYQLHENDLVFARTGGTVGKSFLIKNDVPKAVFASYLIRIILFSKINPQLIHYFFQTNEYWKQIQLKKTGLKTNVNAQILGKIVLPIPPLNEQKRIVTKIEELFSELNNAKTILERTKLQLKQYRQSLLKFAFEGKLTEKWRDENECSVEFELNVLRKLNDKKLKTDSKLILEIPENISELHKIPEKWVWVRLGFLSKLITKGASPKWQGFEYVDNGVLFITSENVGSGKILLNKPKFLKKKFNEKQKRSILQKGDILTNIVGASIGRTAIYDLDNIANINQAVSLIRISDNVNRNYIQYVLNSPFILNYMNLEKVDVARANLSLQNVADFPICLPSIKEQKQIVLKLEQGFSLIKNTENITNSMLKQLDTTKSSILKQAFEGKLIPQDPNDEPAEILLQKNKTRKGKDYQSKTKTNEEEK